MILPERVFGKSVGKTNLVGSRKRANLLWSHVRAVPDSTSSDGLMRAFERHESDDR